MTRVLVCGGRHYSDWGRLVEALGNLDAERHFTTLLEGGAGGADTMAHNWAVSNGIKVLTFPADWRQHGRGAGPIRNRQMLEEGKPDLVVAFPGGRGTASMVRLAREANVEVIEP